MWLMIYSVHTVSPWRHWFLHSVSYWCLTGVLLVSFCHRIERRQTARRDEVVRRLDEELVELDRGVMCTAGIRDQIGGTVR